MAEARAEGVELVGPGGLLGDLTKWILEAEMTEHVAQRDPLSGIGS